MDFKTSPVLFTLDILSKKWTFEIVNELFSGRKRYSDFLELYPAMSSKVLSERLKELYKIGILDKIVINIMPIKSKYQLTPIGKQLHKIFFEMAVFGSICFPEKIFENEPSNTSDTIHYFAEYYQINKEDSLNTFKRFQEEEETL